jgi:hypothetical protein
MSNASAPRPSPPPKRRRRSAVTGPARLVDEGTRPDVPALFRRHLRRHARAEVALTRLRILALRLGAGDVARLPSLRLLVAHPRAAEWEVEVHRALLDPVRRPAVRGLVHALVDGRIAVRAAPLGGWSPDFSVFHGDDGPRRGLVGGHWLERPHPDRGPVLGIELGRPGARALARRFADLWAGAYDVTPALTGLLGRTAERLRAAPGEIDTLPVRR